MKRLATLAISLLAAGAVTLCARNITVHAHNLPATEVFEEIMTRSGLNFVYPSNLLKGLRVTVDADNRPLEDVLDEMFRDTGIVYRMRGDNIILSQRKAAENATVSGFVREEGSEEPLVGVIVTGADGKSRTATNSMGFYSLTLPCGPQSLSFSYMGYEPQTTRPFTLTVSRNVDVNLIPTTTQLSEVEVLASPNRNLSMSTPSIGSLKVSKSAIASTPVIFGESDVIKTIQLEPGVSAGIEGTAGMYVHGGNTDENLYMLDNIPLYQVNHFGGLFSAFNVEALRNVDFYKSSFPARYDGRLSSFMDVNTKDGSMKERHGSLRLGLTSGAFNIDGPLNNGKTTYSVALRRSWYDVLTIPTFAIVNSIRNEDHYSLGYAFTDLNAKLTHRFSERSKAYAMVYYGEDYLKVTNKHYDEDKLSDYDEEKHRLRWGNIVASMGWNYVFTPNLFGELTGAYTRYYSRMVSGKDYGVYHDSKPVIQTRDNARTDNNINDWIIKTDFDWRPDRSHSIRFGAGFTHHSFLPAHTRRTLQDGETTITARELITSYHANEFNLYGGGDWQPAEPLRVNYGLHFSLFNIEGKSHTNLSPRLSAAWSVSDNIAVKAGYSRTVQYVHQLMQSSISLPTDQWVPITADNKPQTADKIAVGAYITLGRDYTLSVEGYYKWMDNLLDYRDEYYLLPPDIDWEAKLTPGSGTSKGIDFKIAKEFGKVTGHIAYSLLWADRRFADKNGGRPFPARFDNRHKINLMLNWKISPRWEMSAAWTGMSGNRFTLATQIWNDPQLAPWHYDMIMGTDVNNFRLPFYHRLDLSARRNTTRGYWTFSLYNAYCNMNTIAVRRDSNFSYEGNASVPVFQKIKLIPIIPSVSYTWLF